jgi:diguanylate cyclase (GGDEF)-like protein
MLSRLSGSLRNRIAVVAGLIFLLGVALVSLFVSHFLHDEMQDVVSKQQLATTEYIARDINGKIKLRMAALRRVADNLPSELLDQHGQLQAWVEDRRAINTLFPTGLMIVPASGGPTLAEVPRLKTRPKSFVDRDWFIGVKQTLKPYISKPLVTRATGEAALVIAVPLLDREGKLLAVLAGITPLATPGFLDLILGAQPGKRGSYQLLDPKHRLYALGTDPAIALTALPEPGKDIFVDQALSGGRGIRVLQNPMQQEELVTIAEIEQNGWLLLARQPAEDAFEPASNASRNALVMSAFVLIPLLALLLSVLSLMLKPFAILARQLHDMADGVRPMTPVTTHTTDEVADVADSFNRLQSKLQEQEERLRNMAHHDSLTGLPNRLTIMARIDSELLRFQRSSTGLALLFLDLDGFKPVNDNYGHQVGDVLLVEIAQRLKHLVRDVDVVARLGGDEFLVLLCDTEAPREAAERVAQECIKVLGVPMLLGQSAIAVGVSIGIATADSHQSPPIDAGKLVSHADSAMYEAKAAGRNRYAVFQPTTKK